MDSKSAIEQVAWATAIEIVEVFSRILRDDEKRDAFVEVYARVTESLERYESEQAPRSERLKPSQN